MSKKDLTFAIIFIISVSILLYYLGSSITGYVTMHCEEGVCKEFCRFDSDCNANEICCQKGDFGVCEDLSICEKEYKFQPESLEIPSPTKGEITFYSILVFLVISIGVVYFLKRKRR